MSNTPYVPVTVTVELDGFEAVFIYECAKVAYEEAFTLDEPVSREGRALKKIRLDAFERLIVKMGGEV